VARADGATRGAYESELEAVVVAVARGLGGRRARARAWALLATLAGGAAMARAVRDPRTRAEIVAATRRAALAI
jgi:hypothetical protein